MKLYELWVGRYLRARYMEYLSPRQLEERAIDVFANIGVLSEQGQIAFQKFGSEGKYWWKLWTEVCTEFQARYGPFPAGFTNGFLKTVKGRMARPSWPVMPRAHRAFDCRPLEAGTYLLRLGHRRHIQEAYSTGRIRIAAASSYDDPSLNQAIKDSELSIQLLCDPRTLWPTTQASATVHAEAMRRRQYIRLTQRSTTDYYVLCCCGQYTLRLFDDFGYDACLIIRNPREFVRRLARVFAESGLSYTMMHGPVRYVDPLKAAPSSVNVFFSKHFRYSYHKEYRLIWVPKQASAQLDAQYIKLGPLTGISEVILLPELAAD